MRCLSLNGDPIEDPEPTSLAHRFCLLFRDLIPTMNLPSPVLSISPSQLASLICTHCGPEVLEIIHAQKIFDIQTLLRVNDLLAVVRLPTDQFRDLKQKVAVQLHDGTWAILIGFQVRVDAFVNTLRNQARIDEGECDQASNPLPSSDQIVLSAAFIARFPFLASLIEHCSMISNGPNAEHLHSILPLLDNLCANLTRSKNNFRYSTHVMHFALSLFIYGGENAYRFVSLNLPGLLPSTTTIRSMMSNSSLRLQEAEFRFDTMQDHFATNGSVLAFAAEDLTGVIAKVIYDSNSNSFVGFDTPIKNARPSPRHYQTDSYAELQVWFEEQPKAAYVNAHVVQPLRNSSADKILPPFVLAAYGVDGTFTAEDVLNRWLWIYEEAKKKQIRLLGFATDADSRYLRSMKVASGFFVSDPDARFLRHSDAFRVDIPSEWHWFFLNQSQLCVFMQV